MEKSPSWSRAHDWKSCRPLKGLEGSNPSFSATSEQTFCRLLRLFYDKSERAHFAAPPLQTAAAYPQGVRRIRKAAAANGCAGVRLRFGIAALRRCLIARKTGFNRPFQRKTCIRRHSRPSFSPVNDPAAHGASGKNAVSSCKLRRKGVQYL